MPSVMSEYERIYFYKILKFFIYAAFGNSGKKYWFQLTDGEDQIIETCRFEQGLKNLNNDYDRKNVLFKRKFMYGDVIENTIK